MAEQELKTVLKDVLESRGVLGEIQARLRAEVYKALQDDSIPKPELCEDNLLLNELIREYLQYNQYMYTDSVLVAESGHHKEPLEREFLVRQLHLPSSTVEQDGNLPLLYHMLTHFVHNQSSSHEQAVPEQQCSQTLQRDPQRSHSIRTKDDHCIIEEPLYPDS